MSDMPRLTMAQADTLFREWRTALSNYFSAMWAAYYLPIHPEDPEKAEKAERIGRQVHLLHVAAYEAGAIAQAAMRSLAAPPTPETTTR